MLSDNLLYEGFWEYCSKFWINKFGIKPTLFFYGDQKDIKVNRSIGEVYDLPFIKEVSVNKKRDWACTWGLFYGASLFNEDICMTCGIDQAPLSDVFFKDIKKYNYNIDYVIGLSEAYNNDNWFVSSHHVAKGKIFKRALNIDDNWEKEVNKVFSFRNKYGNMYGGNDFWGLDELYSSEILNKYEFLKKHTGIHKYLYNNRIDRGYNMNLDINKLINKGYSELHSPRPYKNYSNFLELIYNNTPSFI